MPTCAGCERLISDQYLLRVSPDLEWHAACLKCVDCGQPLDERCTCFVRGGKTYCRRDYISRFAAKCSACSVPFQRCDLVMRAADLIFHVDCFRCAVCERRLVAGDQFALTPGDRLCCRADLDSADVISAGSCDVTATGKCDGTVDDGATSTTTVVRQMNNNNNNNNENETKTSVNNLSETDSASGCGGQSSSQNSSASGGGGSGAAAPATKHGGRSRSHKGSDQKTTRIRTVLNEKQLHTLRTCYGANPRPDALMKEQLVEMTGLSPRVIRVWFQNKRCKDKKRSILLKQIQQHHQDTAVSMVAASPVSHEPQSSIAPVKVHQFQLLPWPAFLQTGGGGGADPLTAAAGGTCPVIGGDYVPDAADVQPTAPFQRLLSSFGHLSDDDEDDAVVSVDEPNGRGLAVGRQHHAVGYLHAAASATVDRLLAPGGAGAFAGTAAQHGIIC